MVAVTFLLARVGVTPPEPEYDPAHYADAPVVEPGDADAHVGERATVCGLVVEASHQPAVGGEPTFLNMGGRHPDQAFTAVIWARDRARFREPPEARYDGRRICVSGPVQLHQGTPQIEVTDPAQIQDAGSGATSTRLKARFHPRA